MALPKFLQPCLASYDLSQLAPKRDKELIITEVLNKGADRDHQWLFKTYSPRQIKAIIKNPTRGMWLKKNLLYWQQIFDIKIPKIKQELAYLDLNPRPELYKKFFKI